jgi:Domain of unknown function (DUF222)
VARFAQHGESDSMPPGPLLTTVVHALTGDDGDGLAALSDDQLVGIIAATRRMESRIAWTQLAAIREFATRRGSQQRDRAEFAADELACGLNLTWQSAAGQIDYATAVAERLPRTFAALAEGRLHPVHVRIVEDETSILSDQDAATADEELAIKAGSLTFGQLRSLAHRLILKLDPEAARKRKEAAVGRRTCAGSGKAPATPAWWPGSSPRMRCWPPGSMWSSGRWTCAPLACPGRCGNCASRPTWTCCRNATAAPPSPTQPGTPTRSGTPTREESPTRLGTPTRSGTPTRAESPTRLGTPTRARTLARAGMLARATRRGLMALVAMSPGTTQEETGEPTRPAAV